MPVLANIRYLSVKQVQRLAYLINKALRENSAYQKHVKPLKPDAWELALKKAVNKDTILPNYRRLGDMHADILEFLIYYFGDAIEAEDDTKDDAARRRAVKLGGGGLSSKLSRLDKVFDGYIDKGPKKPRRLDKDIRPRTYADRMAEESEKEHKADLKRRERAGKTGK